MMHTSKHFYEYGVMTIDNKPVGWNYSKTVDITIHEKTETFSCDMLGKHNRMCLHDLKMKCRMKLRVAAQAEARRKFVADLDAKEKVDA